MSPEPPVPDEEEPPKPLAPVDELPVPTPIGAPGAPKPVPPRGNEVGLGNGIVDPGAFVSRCSKLRPRPLGPDAVDETLVDEDEGGCEFDGNGRVDCDG